MTVGELYYGIGGIVVGMLAILVPVLLRYERMLAGVTKRVDGIESQIEDVINEDKHNVTLCAEHELRFQSFKNRMDTIEKDQHRLDSTFADIGSMKTDIAVLKDTISRWDKGLFEYLGLLNKEMQTQREQLGAVLASLKLNPR